MSLYEKRVLALIGEGGVGMHPWLQRLRLASYHARRGDLGNARAIVAAAREVFGAGESAVAVVHINLAEAICEFYEHGIESSMTKLSRARALSSACHASDDAPAMISVWFAGMYRYRADWARMEGEIRNSICDIERISKDVRCRLGLVLGDAYLEAGLSKLSDSWYQYARRWATDLGDDATVGASIYNRAAFNVFNARLDLVEDKSSSMDFRRLRVEAASANNFGTFYTDQAFSWTLELLQGQVHLLEHCYEDALRLLGQNGSDEEWMDAWPAASLVRATDILLCKCMLGKVGLDFVESYSDKIRATQFGVVGSGDRAIAAHTIALALDKCGSTQSDLYTRISIDSLNEYRSCQDRERVALHRISDLIEATDFDALGGRC